ncbi:hypothetical protein [Acidicapsa ligni]|uniref:hypothetical protein n=1 Tax=Acidicapsa ligni TaxID=542300 RepID=UPI0021DF478D|nr:hypothetical protein [Acidicapsa ligni]
MKKIHCTLAGTFGALLLAFLIVPSSHAQCGGLRQASVAPANWHPQFGQARLLRASLNEDRDRDEDRVSIVGFWHVKFVSDGITTGIPNGIPKGTEVDAGYSQWHSDGTEIMNSAGRAPNTSSFCLGVWEKTGTRRYSLNHFAAAWDPTKGPVGAAGPTGELTGPTSIREEVTLAPNGEKFTGSFTIDNYDESGHMQSHLEGSISGTRITVSTPPSSIF